MVDKDSILASTKKLLNIDAEDQAFDTDLVVLINGEFMTLQQLGLGPDEGFSISDYSTTWHDYVEDDRLIGTVKTYVYMRVRMIFDPPASSVVADAINNRIAELQWRLNVWAEQLPVIDAQKEAEQEHNKDPEDIEKEENGGEGT